MSMQVILRKPEAIASLADLAAHADVFPLSDGTLGVAFPSKIVDEVSEEKIVQLLSQIEFFDLGSGCWKKPNQALQPTAQSGRG